MNEKIASRDNQINKTSNINMSNGVEATGTGHFPSRVMAILNLEEVHQTMHWLPDGKAFIISNPPQFANTVLKTHFKGIQLHSFNKSLTRELNTMQTRPALKCQNTLDAHNFISLFLSISSV